jgi:hypothetical protein
LFDTVFFTILAFPVALISERLEYRRLHNAPGQENVPPTIQKIPTPSAGKKERASAITLPIPGT